MPLQMEERESFLIASSVFVGMSLLIGASLVAGLAMTSPKAFSQLWAQLQEAQTWVTIAQIEAVMLVSGGVVGLLLQKCDSAHAMPWIGLGMTSTAVPEEVLHPELRYWEALRQDLSTFDQEARNGIPVRDRLLQESSFDGSLEGDVDMKSSYLAVRIGA